MSDYLEKATEAAAQAEYDDWNELGEAERDECRAAARRGLEAAAPFIREQERQNLREALLSEAEGLERPNRPGEDLTAAALRRVKAQALRDFAAQLDEVSTR